MNKFKLNKNGVKELLKSSKMQNVLNENAKRIIDRCGSGYEKSLYVGRTRANASVKASTMKARKDNLENNIILKALR